jgi:MSHA biogenesis protein MshP
MRARSHGFSLVTAIFLIVIVALVAAFMVSIGSIQSATSAYAIVGARAQFAAVSGLEWGIHQVLSNPGAPSCFASPTSFTLSGGGAANFVVTLACAVTPTVTEGASQYVVFNIDVVAESGAPGSADYFSRRLSAAVSTAP